MENFETSHEVTKVIDLKNQDMLTWKADFWSLEINLTIYKHMDAKCDIN